jgi:hypothetical protein
MASIKEKLQKIIPQSKEILIGGESFEFKRLNQKDYNYIKQKHGVDFASTNPQDLKITLDVLSTMIFLSLRKTYHDVTEDDVQEYIMTTDFMTSENLTAALAWMQGASHDEVQRQVERVRADMEKRRREAEQALAEAAKAS